MHESIRSIVKPQLYESIIELSKNDPIFKQVLDKSDSIENCINTLIAGLILISDREQYMQNTIFNILKSNPQVKKILELKNDKSMLPKGTI